MKTCERWLEIMTDDPTNNALASHCAECPSCDEARSMLNSLIQTTPPVSDLALARIRQGVRNRVKRQPSLGSGWTWTAAAAAALLVFTFESSPILVP